MSKTTWLVLLACAGAAFALYRFNVGSIQTTITNGIQNLKPTVDSIINSIKQNPIPVIMGAIGIGIPLLIAAGKRIAQITQQSKQEVSEAQSQTVQIYTEKAQLEKQLTESQTALANAQQQLKIYTDQDSGVKTLANSLEEAQTLVQQKQVEINSLRDQIVALNNVIAELKLKTQIVVK